MVSTSETKNNVVLTNIKIPHENDVLFGRGVTTNKWPGNEQFRSLVGLNKVGFVPTGLS